MSVPQKTWLYFLVDSKGRSYYVQNGSVLKSTLPKPLPQHPKGWKDIGISFGTNFKYWSLNRSFTVPMFFPGDGATICRWAIYSGLAYEEEMYVVILKVNPETTIYELEYKGRIDFVKHIDEPRKGVTVNTIEGGVLSYLTANEAVPYEIKLGVTNPKTIQIYFDGQNMFDRFKYSNASLKVDGIENESTLYFIPFPYISNEGDSVGVIYGSQRFDLLLLGEGHTPTAINQVCADSANYYIAFDHEVTINIKGQLKRRIFSAADSFFKPDIFINTSDGNRYTLFDDNLSVDEGLNPEFTIDVDIDITLAANEKAFLMELDSTGNNGSYIEHILTDLYVSFKTKTDPSYALAIKSVDLLDQVVQAMTDGKYRGDSAFLRERDNIVYTSTNAIRKFEDPTVKISLQDLFIDMDCIYDMGMKISGDVIYIEPKRLLYNDDSEILDIGEISKFKLKFADDLLCNVGEFGYKSQDYRQKNGRLEFNTTTVFKFPVNTINRKFTKILKSRGDSLGIESLRAMIFDKTTTDNTGDNQSFVVNVEEGTNVFTSEGVFVESGVLGDNYFTAVGNLPLTVGQTLRITDTNLNNRDFTIEQLSQAFFTWFIKVQEPVVDEVLTSPMTIEVLTMAVVKLKRVEYDSITGVLDNTVYNIEELTPHRLMQANGGSLRSIMHQLQSRKITWVSSDKNADLVTVKDGVTIAEKQDETISTLGDIIHLGRYGEFETVVPLNFAKLFSSIGTGYVKGTFIGQPIYFLPIGTMTAKPATNAAQTWKLLLAPNNSLSVLEQLSLEGLFTTDSMGNTIFTTNLNPLHFNKYNYALPAKYQHKEMYDDQFQNRVQEWLHQAVYLQKFQKTEAIPVQAITKGLATPDVEIYRASNAELVRTEPMDVVPTGSVQLPYILHNYNIVTSTLDEDIYFVVISVAGTKVRISELIDLREEHPGTRLFEYSHTTNKNSTYWTGFAPCVRVEAKMLPWKPDSTFTDYMNEKSDYEVIDGIAMPKRNIRVPLIPDWMALKLSDIMLLNRCYIDGVRYARTPESKWQVKETVGTPLNSYLVEIARAQNNNGLGTDETGSEEEIVISYTLQASAFGLADEGAVIDIDVENEP